MSATPAKAEADDLLGVRAAAQEFLTAFASLVRPDYQVSRVHRCIAAHLEAVRAGLIKRLWIRTHPRLGKSTLVSQLFPAWWMASDPRASFLLASYGQELASDHGRAVRDLMMGSTYRTLFPGARLRGVKANDEAQAGSGHRLDLTAGGGMRASGIGGPATGRGASACLLIDDPIKDAAEANSPAIQHRNMEWYAGVARLRLAPGAAIVGIDTSWGDKVLGSMLIQQPGWHVLRLPAICEGAPPCCEMGDWRKPGEAAWPERWPESELRALAEELANLPGVGTRVWNTHFQQHATAPEGERMKREWMQQEYIEAPARFERVIAYWDPKLTGKASGSWCVALVWGQVAGRIYLLDRVRIRAEFPEVLDSARNLMGRWPDAAQYFEPTATGPAAVSVLRREFPGVLLDQAVQGGKVERLDSVLPLWQAGSVWLPTRRAAPWIDEYRDELLAFPHGPHDDYVDATSGALRVLQRAARSLVAARPSVVLQADWTSR